MVWTIHPNLCSPWQILNNTFKKLLRILAFSILFVQWHFLGNFAISRTKLKGEEKVKSLFSVLKFQVSYYVVFIWDYLCIFSNSLGSVPFLSWHGPEKIFNLGKKKTFVKWKFIAASTVFMKSKLQHGAFAVVETQK